jgi:ATP-dependent DNA helicase RecG
MPHPILSVPHICAPIWSPTIEDLLNAKEGEACQFKEAKTRFDFTEAVKCCCALANCGGGKLVFGRSDKRPRQVLGSQAFDQPERTRKGLIENIHVMVDFQLYEHEGKRILVFDVASRPLGLPVQADGIAWWYEGDSLIPMPEEIRRKIYDETGFDFSASICAGATLHDLDKSAIENFRTNWIQKSHNKQIKNLPVKQLLQDAGAITKDGVTYAALILFGTHDALRQYLAQSEFVFEYRSSEVSGPAAQREEFTVGFFSCYDSLWKLINLRNDKQHYQDGLFVFDIPTFNERVVREALLNAVSHRNYQLGGSVFVRQYRDRLVVESPGGFPPGIMPENILYKQSPRNKRIAEILSLCGLVERSGQGMDLMYELSVRESKELPNFFGSDGYQVKLTLNGVVLDKRLLSFLQKIGEEQQEQLSTEDFLLIDALFHDRPLPENLRLRLNHLIEMGIIERIGRKKYVLARGLYEAAGKSGVHTRLVGLDRDTNKELLLKHIRKNGEKGTPFKELEQVLPSHSRGQIQVLIRELKLDGLIYMEGNTKSALWFAVSLGIATNCN